MTDSDRPHWWVIPAHLADELAADPVAQVRAGLTALYRGTWASAVLDLAPALRDIVTAQFPGAVLVEETGPIDTVWRLPDGRFIATAWDGPHVHVRVRDRP